MKSITRCIFLVLMLQFYSCASQTDSITVEPSKEKKTEQPPKNGGQIINKNKKASGKGIGKSEVTVEDDEIVDKLKEEGETGLSIISYENVLEKDRANLPVKGQKVKLMIKNNHNQAMWYLMPVSGEKKMPVDAKFKVNPEAEPPFFVKKYGTDSERLIELIYHGEPNQSFRAFYVEAKSFLLFRNYDLGTYPEGDYVPFWAVKALDVNDKMTLDEWLPFSVVSSPNVTIHNRTESGAAKWTNLGENATFPSEAVIFIQANGIKKYQIPVGVVR